MPIKCPRCGMDVMITGWVELQQVRKTWMRFKGGPVTIAEETRPADIAQCAECGAVLPLTPTDLLRAA